jgi:hypothetical protein
MLALNTLDLLEKVNHLLRTDLAISVLVTLLYSLPDLLVVIWRGHTHLEADISVCIEKLLSL